MAKPIVVNRRILSMQMCGTHAYPFILARIANLQLVYSNLLRLRTPGGGVLNFYFGMGVRFARLKIGA